MSVIKKPRPSSMPLLEQCPRFVSRPDDPDSKKDDMDLAAEEGTMLHAFMERMVKNVPPDEWETYIEGSTELSPDQVPVIQEAAEQIHDILALGLPVTSLSDVTPVPVDGHYTLGQHVTAHEGIFLEVSLVPTVAAPGTADLVALIGNSAILVDYKFTRVEREHDAQMLSYVDGLFNCAKGIEFVEVRIVAPRLSGGTHAPVHYSRDDHRRFLPGLQRIVEKAADPFTPGCPGVPCSFCAGNGRCPWQMQSLKNVPPDVTDVDLRSIWQPVLAADTPEMRGQRRKLCVWLDRWTKAVKEADKEWALLHPDAVLPGFRKSVCLGRLAYNKDSTKDIATTLNTHYGYTFSDMMEFMKFNETAAVDYISLHNAIPKTQAKTTLRTDLAPFMERGAETVRFTPEKTKPKQLD